MDSFAEYVYSPQSRRARHLFHHICDLSVMFADSNKLGYCIEQRWGLNCDSQCGCYFPFVLHIFCIIFFAWERFLWLQPWDFLVITLGQTTTTGRGMALLTRLWWSRLGHRCNEHHRESLPALRLQDRFVKLLQIRFLWGVCIRTKFDIERYYLEVDVYSPVQRRTFHIIEAPTSMQRLMLVIKRSSLQLTPIDTPASATKDNGCYLIRKSAHIKKTRLIKSPAIFRRQKTISI